MKWLDKNRLFALLVSRPVLWLSLGLFLAMFLVRPEFASLANLEILGLSVAILLVLALGQTFVLITAGIDLSLPAVISLASVIGASVMASGSPLADSVWAVPAGVLAMLAVGLAIGAFQGFAVGLLQMPPFLVSLTSLMFFGGLAVWVTESECIQVPPAFIEIWYGRMLGVPYPIWLAVLIAGGAHLVLTRTIMGRWLYAIGHSQPTALISGVPVTRTILFAYMASGLCAAIAAIFYAARLYAGSPTLVRNEILLDCIGAAVIGGTSLFGGRGKVSGVLLGVLFIAMVGNGLNMLGWRYWHVVMTKGGVILLAALLDSMGQRISETRQA